jgi:hypothetical protein
MPRPAYILFSESGAIDEHTNKISFFDVIEAFDVKPIPTDGTPRIAKKLRAVAVWIKDAEDTPDMVFEIEFRCTDKDGTVLFGTETDTFSFSGPFHRHILPKIVLDGFTSLGEYSLEARIRRSGTQDWAVRQVFPFVVRHEDGAKETVEKPVT